MDVTIRVAAPARPFDKCPHCHSTQLVNIWGLGWYCPTPRCPGPRVPVSPAILRAASRWDKFQRSQIQPVAVYGDGSGGGGGGARKTGSKGKQAGPTSGTRPGSSAMLPAIAQRLEEVAKKPHSYEPRSGKAKRSAKSVRNASKKGKGSQS